jgi:hypothetical protein
MGKAGDQHRSPLPAHAAPAISGDTFMMKHYLKYVVLTLCACLGSTAFAGPLDFERQALTMVHVITDVGDLYGAQATRLDLTLAQWRTGSESTSEAMKSNLIASSNHFVMETVETGAEKREGFAPT